MIVCKAGHIHYLFLQNLLIFKHFNVACLSRRGYDVQQSSKTQEKMHLVFSAAIIFGIMATGMVEALKNEEDNGAATTGNTTTGSGTTTPPKKPGTGQSATHSSTSPDGTPGPNASTKSPNVTRPANGTNPDNKEKITTPKSKPNPPKKDNAAGSVEYGYGIIVMPAILLIRG